MRWHQGSNPVDRAGRGSGKKRGMGGVSVGGCGGCRLRSGLLQVTVSYTQRWLELELAEESKNIENARTPTEHHLYYNRRNTNRTSFVSQSQ